LTVRTQWDWPVVKEDQGKRTGGGGIRTGIGKKSCPGPVKNKKVVASPGSVLLAEQKHPSPFVTTGK